MQFGIKSGVCVLTACIVALPTLWSHVPVMAQYPQASAAKFVYWPDRNPD